MSTEQPDIAKNKETAAKEKDAPKASPQADKSASKEADAKKGGQGTDSKTVQYNKDITVKVSDPIPHMDRGPVKAYKAIGQRNAPSNLVAFVCEKHLLPRWQAGTHYSAIMNSHIPRLVASGVMPWPVDGGTRYVFIYENNWQTPLFRTKGKLALGMKSDHVMEEFVKPMVAVLHDFQSKGFVHGGIRLDNFFQGKTENLRDMILGESLTTPCSYMQPVLYEPIDRAMADPIARGMGTFADDLYSFGVVLTILLRQHDPMEGKSDEEIIHEKIEKGSYVALTGKDRFTGEILELLRGVLHDDRAARWKIDDVIQWMDGTRLSPKQVMKRKKASRALNVGGQRFFRPEILAFYSQDHGNQIMQVVEDKKLEQWVERSLEDKDAMERMEMAIETAKDFGEGEAYQNSLLSRLAIALDPSGPIRYRGLSFRPDGFVTALAEAFVLEKDLNPFREIIQQNIVMFWLNAQVDNNVDFGSIATRFESCRINLKNDHVGFGLELCLYFLSSEAPCMSKVIPNYFARSADEFALAIEDNLGKNSRESLLLDRHSVAFLTSRDSKSVDSYLIELNSYEEMKKLIGNLGTFTLIQDRHKLPPLPHTTAHFVKLMSPIMARFHDAELRERLNNLFNKIKNSGDLARLKAALENPEMIEDDFQAFLKAMQHYNELKEDKSKLQKKLGSKEKMGRGTGQNLSAILSALIGGILILGIMFYKLS